MFTKRYTDINNNNNNNNKYFIDHNKYETWCSQSEIIGNHTRTSRQSQSHKHSYKREMRWEMK